jgi:flagellin-like protein
VDETMMVPSSKKVRRAVSPVLATLMMVAVAVALSVIIFTWSQGFLSQTGEAASGQQAQQNIAAQSGILIESVKFTASDTAPEIKITVRNVGGVTVTLGSFYIRGTSGNLKFTGYLTYSWKTSASTDVTESSGTWTIDQSHDTQAEVQIPPRSTVTFTLSGSTSAGQDTTIGSGDVITIKITTTAGTSTQGTYTVP